MQTACHVFFQDRPWQWAGQSRLPHEVMPFTIDDPKIQQRVSGHPTSAVQACILALYWHAGIPSLTAGPRCRLQ
jgi:hypothetical protein